MTQGAESAQAILGGLVRDLSPDQLKQCLEFARDWNTNSRRCHAAQAMLQAIISQHTPEVGSLESLVPLTCQYFFHACSLVALGLHIDDYCVIQHIKPSAGHPRSNGVLANRVWYVSILLCETLLNMAVPASDVNHFQELRTIPGIGAVLDALSAYTERHLARMDRLRRSVSLLDYTLGCMHVIEETALEVCSFCHVVIKGISARPLHVCAFCTHLETMAVETGLTVRYSQDPRHSSGLHTWPRCLPLSQG